MDIRSGVGTEIRFLGKNGYDDELEKAKEELITGKEYTVKSMSVGRSSSTVTLKENDKMYNTVMFENVSDDYEIHNWFEEAYGMRIPPLKKRKMVMKYRKKPVVIEAIQFLGNPETEIEVCEFVGKDLEIKTSSPSHIMIPTLEGVMMADAGDFIIKGIKGEFYPCKPDIFEATYEKVEEEGRTKMTKGEFEKNYKGYLADVENLIAVPCDCYDIRCYGWK